MTKDNTSSIEKWWEEFNEKPFEALDRLLFRRVFMGELNRNETDEILFRLFHNKSKKMRRQLDELMKEWFEAYWGKSPGSMSSSRWARIVQNAFIVVYRLNLGETALFLRDTYVSDKSWIRSLYIAPPRDPEGWLLRTLALCQEDQRLLPVWMRICRWEEDIPIHYTSIGLMGLRKLPERNGEPPGDIPKAFFKGAVSLAEALVEKNMPECKEFWLREMRAVTALYPRTKQYWAGHFSPFLSYRPDSLPAQWLDKVIPKVSSQFKRKSNLFLEPPPKHELEHILKLLSNKSLEDIRYELDSFFDRHHSYAYQTGDSYFLVRALSNIAYRIFRQDSAYGLYALGLVEEAFTWEPYNPLLWIQKANIEAFRGNYIRAEGLLWEAKRRFPEYPDVRNNLADLLYRGGEQEIAETLYRQTLLDFPKNVVCRNGLAEVLKSQDKFEEAEEVYSPTIKNVVEKQEEYVISSLSSKIADATDIEYNVELAETVKAGTEIEKIEIELGRINLRHWQSRMAEDEEKEKYRTETLPTLEKLLKKAPQHIPTLLVKGFWLADLDPQQAENYLSRQAETHPNTLGFHLMELRVKGLLNKELDSAVWNRLIQNFPGRETVVKLEHTLYEINKGNGNRIHELEKLRKQISKRRSHLPAALQKNEEWVTSTIEYKLFKDIDITQPITEKSVDTVKKNFHRNEIALKSIVEQCICSAI